MKEDVRLRPYGAGAQIFHWVTVVLVVAAFVLSSGGPEARVYAPERAGELLVHETLGLCVFLVTLARLVWRMVDQAPDDPPMAVWLHVSSRLVQVLLFILLLAVPLTAIAGAWLEGHPVTVYAVGPIGPWLAESKGLGRELSQVHTWAGDALIWLAGFHAAAALFHHFVLKDRVLVAMLPVRR